MRADATSPMLSHVAVRTKNLEPRQRIPGLRRFCHRLRIGKSRFTHLRSVIVGMIKRQEAAFRFSATSTFRTIDTEHHDPSIMSEIQLPERHSQYDVWVFLSPSLPIRPHSFNITKTPSLLVFSAAILIVFGPLARTGNPGLPVGDIQTALCFGVALWILFNPALIVFTNPVFISEIPAPHSRPGAFGVFGPPFLRFFTGIFAETLAMGYAVLSHIFTFTGFRGICHTESLISNIDKVKAPEHA